MVSIPSVFHTKSTHRIEHFSPDRDKDFDRLEDVLADALGAARAAVNALDKLPYDDWKPVESWRRDLVKKLDERRILNDDFRHSAQVILRELSKRDSDEPQSLDYVIRRLRDALNGSLRVADLLAAEEDIGWHRGIGR